MTHFPVLIYALAYGLSLARLPFAVLPYVCKIGLYAVSRGWLEQHWHAYPIQVLRAVGDLLNWLMGAFLILSVAQTPFFQLWFALAWAAETIRLTAEKGVMAISAAWQSIPHRHVAGWLAGGPLATVFSVYCHYYGLSDQDRLTVILENLREKTSANRQTAQKLKYVSAFRIVPDDVSLRCGKVRDVAHGEIYVHRRWTNHPGLLAGLALRRSPWIFDPRHVVRPFYYRTLANRLMTLFVFENAARCPLYAVYQFGHEIKSARYDAFYRLLRWLRIDSEQPVDEDGVYSFEPLAVSLKMVPARGIKQHPIWTDDEVLHDLASDAGTNPPLSMEIAERYTYPLLYVEEVLAAKIQAHLENASNTPSATTDGASQCG